jgi:hypothetical protein
MITFDNDRLKRLAGTLGTPCHIPSPLTLPDTWIARSALQKAIRRGDEELAVRAAMTLLKTDPPVLWMRLRCRCPPDSPLIRDEPYIGEMVWNRMRFIKDPTTGKRVSRLNPESEWVVEPVPELRIVDQPLWERVQERLTGIRNSDRAQAIRKREFWKERRPKHLLTGKAFCGCCGGALSTVGQD